MSVDSKALRPDPPMAPTGLAIRWIESGPEVLDGEMRHAVLATRIGMALNSIHAQLTLTDVALKAERAKEGLHTRDINLALLMTAATTLEALHLIEDNRRLLSDWAVGAGAKPELIKRVEDLCSREHPIRRFLGRSRNKLGFHWDEKVVRRSVAAFRRNKKLVWVETTQDQMLHSFALAVTIHGLFPEADSSDPAVSEKAIRDALSQFSEATNLMLEFFTASTYGYMREIGGVLHERGEATSVETGSVD